MRAHLSISERFRFAFAVARARYAAGKGDLAKAISILDKAYNVDGHIDAENAPFLAVMLYAKLCQRAGMVREALFALQFAVERLDRGEYGNGPDRDYLYFYCKWIISILSHFRDSKAFSMALSIGGSYMQLDIPRTSHLIKRLFVIPPDDGPKVDRYLECNMPPIP
jgi:hypothetical protein